MANQWFRFKHFLVKQDKCAMKVGTDGVLLGAWADVDNAVHVLDVGTGTGLIALMVAQRNELAVIHAIEKDHTACEQADENFKNSQWENRLQAFPVSLQHYARVSRQKYDLIVCNPPYFVDALRAPDPKRKLARHNDELPLNVLAGCVNQLLTECGKFSVILPPDEMNRLEGWMVDYGLLPERRCRVHSLPDKPVKRLLMEFSRDSRSCREETLVIEAGGRHEYTDEYKNVVKNFYLAL